MGADMNPITPLRICSRVSIANSSQTPHQVIMKTSRFKTYSLLAAFAALAVAPAASFAATNILIQPVGSTVMSDGFGNQCSSSGGGGTWQNWYINAPGITNF